MDYKMEDLDTYIESGLVVTEDGPRKINIGIKDQKIVYLGNENLEAKTKINAENLYVLPGGVDPHVHVDQPSGPDVEMADNFQSATKSAAAGGNTTIIPFAMQVKGESLRKCVEEYHKKADGNLYVDTSFHLIISDPTPQVLGQELPALSKDGYTSFKVFNKKIRG